MAGAGATLDPQWQASATSLTRTLKTKDFKTAVNTIQAIADVAEQLNHHPDLSLQNYNMLTITTTSHDAAGLTEKDFELARQIDRIITE